MNVEMALPRSFRRTIRAAQLKLVYSAEWSVTENLRAFEEVMRKVSASVFIPEVVVPKVEEVVEAVPDRTSVLSLPARDRDPALVQQEINGCKGLLLEVIRRAAYDWVLYRTSTRILHKKLAEQAFLWLFKEQPGHQDWRERVESGKHITSFISICGALDLDPDDVRNHVKRLTPKNVMSVGRPPEYRRREPTNQSEEESPLTVTGADLETEWSVIEDDHSGHED